MVNISNEDVPGVFLLENGETTYVDEEADVGDGRNSDFTMDFDEDEKKEKGPIEDMLVIEQRQNWQRALKGGSWVEQSRARNDMFGPDTPVIIHQCLTNREDVQSVMQVGWIVPTSSTQAEEERRRQQAQPVAAKPLHRSEDPEVQERIKDARTKQRLDGKKKLKYRRA